MTTKIISGTITTGYVLSASYSAISIAATGTIFGLAGLVGSSGGSGFAGGIGLTVLHLATVTNTGVISGGAGGTGGQNLAGPGGSGGTGGAGITLTAGGSIGNTGTITGGLGGLGGASLGGGYGSAGAAGDGVDITSGGAVTNGSAAATNALIKGATGVNGGAAVPATVANFGTIEGTGFNGDGVKLFAGGSVTNGASTSAAALIEGSYVGVLLGNFDLSQTGTVANSGAIEGSSDGVIERVGAGSLINGSATDTSALITGATGVYGSYVGALSVTNFGTIQGATGLGIWLTGGGSVTNGSAADQVALIKGFTGVYGPAGYNTKVTNFGTIQGTGGTAVQFLSASDRLILEGGSKLIGKIGSKGPAAGKAAGGGGALELASGTGSITGLGSLFTGFGSYFIDAGGAWTLTGTNTPGGQSLTVNGALNATGVLGGAAAVTVAATGVIDENTAATLTLESTSILNEGLLESAGKDGMVLLGATVENLGTIESATASHVLLKGADIEGGTLLSVGTGKIETGAGVNILDGTFANIIESAALWVLNNTGLTVEGKIAGKGKITLSASAGTAIVTVGAAGATLSGGGVVVLGNSVGNEIVGAGPAATLTNASDKIQGAGILGGGQMSLINSKGATILSVGTVGLTIDTGTHAVTNGGLLEAYASTLTIKSAIGNTGYFETSNGTIVLAGAVTGSGTAKIVVVLDAKAAFNEAVTFVGSGTLELANSQTYAGKVTGFSLTGATAFDLDDIAFIDTTHTTAKILENKFTYGVLTVTDGTHTAKITLAGNFSSSTFTTSSVGHGGTTVVDPTALPDVARFAAQAAAIGGGQGLVGAAIHLHPPASVGLLASGR